jgi:opacity protein-like surface antigen
MRHAKSAAAVLAATILCASNASAQVKWDITPFAGYYIASDLYNSYSSTQAGSSGVELTNSFAWGGRLTGISRRGAIEFAYTRTGSDIKLKQPLAGQPRPGNVGRLDLDNYDLNFIGYEPTGNPKVTPFGVIGIGWTITHPDVDLSTTPGAPKVESNSLFNFNFGLGVRVAMNEKVAARFEGRWRVTDTNLQTSSGLWCDPFGYCYSYSSEWYDAGELEAGISYSFK